MDLRWDNHPLQYPLLTPSISQAPSNLCHNKSRTNVLQRLVKSRCFARLAGLASSALSAWMPWLHRHYKTCLDALTDYHDHLVPNFANSVWAAVAFNFGPQTVTGKHRDAANLPFRVCSVTALGKFDHTKGGHTVLWEFKLVVEFPPGSTILIPSAAVSHSNTPIADHKRHRSFTQYSAGGLFRWVDQGFQKTTKYKKSLSEEEAVQLPGLNKARCALGMSLFSSLDELRTSKKKRVSLPAPLLDTLLTTYAAYPHHTALQIPTQTLNTHTCMPHTHWTKHCTIPTQKQ